nr:hypothetical protein 12 [bacterium]
MAEKKCKCCGHIKGETDFYKRGSGKRRATCAICYKKRKRVLEARPELRFKAYRRSAKRRDIPFDLTLIQFKKFENKPCRYCGGKVYPISLDRIDNDIGYVIDNVASCCFRCNSLKHVFDEKEFLEQIVAIYEFQKNKTDLENE